MTEIELDSNTLNNNNNIDISSNIIFISENEYYYELNSDIIELKKIYKNLTFIEITPEIKEFIINKYNLDEKKDKLYLIIHEYQSIDSNFATSNYNYKFVLQNGTDLNLSNINEDIYINIYAPIKDLDIIKYNYSLYFAEQGYDIYDKNSSFYNDICSSAHLYNNDIIIKDRKKDIYPNNITICKENCYYNGIIREEERIICHCNLNNNSKENNNDKNDFLYEDNGNFFSYLLDNINYKIFICYRLILSFNNFKNNISFYSILCASFIVICLNLVFYCYVISKIKIELFKNAPTSEKIKNEKKKGLIRQKTINKIYDIHLEPTKRKSKKYHSFNPKSLLKNIERKFSKQISEKKEEDINQLTYERARYKDKRNIIIIFKSIIFDKIDLIKIFQSKHKLQIILISQYITLLILNIFFNTLLYSNEIISKKYHNNGELDFFVTLLLSLLSNIITSIISFYINYSNGIEERLDQIKDIKKEFYYYYNSIRLIKLLKIKFIILFFSEIIIICCCFYYICIFFIVYSYCTISLIIDYITSLLESLITSLIITIIITVLRKIGLILSNKNIYNTSKYINDKF